MAKFSREQALRERRARKQEKKDDRKQAALGLGLAGPDTADEPADDTDSDVPAA